MMNFSTQPAVACSKRQQSRTLATVAGKMWTGSQGILPTAENNLPSPRAKGGCRELVHDLLQGAHQHGMCRVSKHRHIRLQHIIMEARCQQPAVLEPLGPIQNQKAFSWEGMGEGELGNSDNPAPPVAVKIKAAHLPS
jgi:hypothetical protein